jgi:hypothetical protein
MDIFVDIFMDISIDIFMDIFMDKFMDIQSAVPWQRLGRTLVARTLSLSCWASTMVGTT